MKFLADESVEYRFVTKLRKLEYDISSIAENNPGITDTEVLTIAFDQQRILITNDKDFGELVYRIKLPHKGIILFRLSEENAQSKYKSFIKIMKKYQDKVANSFVVVTDKKIRIRKTATT